MSFKPLLVFAVDFGQRSDYTALTINQITTTPNDMREMAKDAMVQWRPKHELVDIRRWDLMTPYPQIVRDLRRMYDDPRITNYEKHLIIDVTGVGVAVNDTMREHKFEPTCIYITSGHSWHVERVRGLGVQFNVPKRELCYKVAVIFDDGRIDICSELPLAKAMRDELLNFKVKITSSGNDTYEAWREGDHDDIVLSYAVGAWWVESVYIPPSLTQPDDSITPTPLADLPR